MHCECVFTLSCPAATINSRQEPGIGVHVTSLPRPMGHSSAEASVGFFFVTRVQRVCLTQFDSDDSNVHLQVLASPDKQHLAAPSTQLE